jgi:hypothetical protein
MSRAFWLNLQSLEGTSYMTAENSALHEEGTRQEPILIPEVV